MPVPRNNYATSNPRPDGVQLDPNIMVVDNAAHDGTYDRFLELLKFCEKNLQADRSFDSENIKELSKLRRSLSRQGLFDTQGFFDLQQRSRMVLFVHSLVVDGEYRYRDINASITESLKQLAVMEPLAQPLVASDMVESAINANFRDCFDLISCIQAAWDQTPRPGDVKPSDSCGREILVSYAVCRLLYRSGKFGSDFDEFYDAVTGTRLGPVYAREGLFLFVIDLYTRGPFGDTPLPQWLSSSMIADHIFGESFQVIRIIAGSSGFHFMTIAAFYGQILHGFSVDDDDQFRNLIKCCGKMLDPFHGGSRYQDSNEMQLLYSDHMKETEENRVETHHEYFRCPSFPLQERLNISVREEKYEYANHVLDKILNSEYIAFSEKEDAARKFFGLLIEYGRFLYDTKISYKETLSSTVMPHIGKPYRVLLMSYLIDFSKLADELQSLHEEVRLYIRLRCRQTLLDILRYQHGPGKVEEWPGACREFVCPSLSRHKSYASWEDDFLSQPANTPLVWADELDVNICIHRVLNTILGKDDDVPSAGWKLPELANNSVTASGTEDETMLLLEQQEFTNPTVESVDVPDSEDAMQVEESRDSTEEDFVEIADSDADEGAADMEINAEESETESEGIVVEIATSTEESEGGQSLEEQQEEISSDAGYAMDAESFDSHSQLASRDERSAASSRDSETFDEGRYHDLPFYENPGANITQRSDISGMERDNEEETNAHEDGLGGGNEVAAAIAAEALLSLPGNESPERERGQRPETSLAVKDSDCFSEESQMDEVDDEEKHGKSQGNNEEEDNIGDGLERRNEMAAEIAAGALLSLPGNETPERERGGRLLTGMVVGDSDYFGEGNQVDEEEDEEKHGKSNTHGDGLGGGNKMAIAAGALLSLPGNEAPERERGGRLDTDMVVGDSDYFGEESQVDEEDEEKHGKGRGDNEEETNTHGDGLGGGNEMASEIAVEALLSLPCNQTPERERGGRPETGMVVVESDYFGEESQVEEEEDEEKHGKSQGNNEEEVSSHSLGAANKMADEIAAEALLSLPGNQTFERERVGKLQTGMDGDSDYFGEESQVDEEEDEEKHGKNQGEIVGTIENRDSDHNFSAPSHMIGDVPKYDDGYDPEHSDGHDFDETDIHGPVEQTKSQFVASEEPGLSVVRADTSRRPDVLDEGYQGGESHGHEDVDGLPKQRNISGYEPDQSQCGGTEESELSEAANTEDETDRLEQNPEDLSLPLSNGQSYARRLGSSYSDVHADDERTLPDSEVDAAHSGRGSDTEQNSDSSLEKDAHDPHQQHVTTIEGPKGSLTDVAAHFQKYQPHFNDIRTDTATRDSSSQSRQDTNQRVSVGGNVSHAEVNVVPSNRICPDSRSRAMEVDEPEVSDRGSEVDRFDSLEAEIDDNHLDEKMSDSADDKSETNSHDTEPQIDGQDQGISDTISSDRQEFLVRESKSEAQAPPLPLDTEADERLQIPSKADEHIPTKAAHDDGGDLKVVSLRVEEAKMEKEESSSTSPEKLARTNESGDNSKEETEVLEIASNAAALEEEVERARPEPPEEEAGTLPAETEAAETHGDRKRPSEAVKGSETGHEIIDLDVKTHLGSDDVVASLPQGEQIREPSPDGTTTRDERKPPTDQQDVNDSCDYSHSGPSESTANDPHDLAVSAGNGFNEGAPAVTSENDNEFRTMPFSLKESQVELDQGSDEMSAQKSTDARQRPAPGINSQPVIPHTTKQPVGQSAAQLASTKSQGEGTQSGFPSTSQQDQVTLPFNVDNTKSEGTDVLDETDEVVEKREEEITADATDGGPSANSSRLESAEPTSAKYPTQETEYAIRMPTTMPVSSNAHSETSTETERPSGEVDVAQDDARDSPTDCNSTTITHILGGETKNEGPSTPQRDVGGDAAECSSAKMTESPGGETKSEGPVASRRDHLPRKVQNEKSGETDILDDRVKGVENREEESAVESEVATDGSTHDGSLHADRGDPIAAKYSSPLRDPGIQRLRGEKTETLVAELNAPLQTHIPDDVDEGTTRSKQTKSQSLEPREALPSYSETGKLEADSAVAKTLSGTSEEAKETVNQGVENTKEDAETRVAFHGTASVLPSGNVDTGDPILARYSSPTRDPGLARLLGSGEKRKRKEEKSDVPTSVDYEELPHNSDESVASTMTASSFADKHSSLAETPPSKRSRREPSSELNSVTPRLETIHEGQATTPAIGSVTRSARLRSRLEATPKTKTSDNTNSSSSSLPGDSFGTPRKGLPPKPPMRSDSSPVAVRRSARKRKGSQPFGGSEFTISSSSPDKKAKSVKSESDLSQTSEGFATTGYGRDQSELDAPKLDGDLCDEESVGSATRRTKRSAVDSTPKSGGRRNRGNSAASSGGNKPDDSSHDDGSVASRTRRSSQRSSVDSATKSTGRRNRGSSTEGAGGDEQSKMRRSVAGSGASAASTSSNRSGGTRSTPSRRSSRIKSRVEKP